MYCYVVPSTCNVEVLVPVLLDKITIKAILNDFLSDAVTVLSQLQYVDGVLMREGALEISQHVIRNLIHQK